jgi:hypothetical protein
MIASPFVSRRILRFCVLSLWSTTAWPVLAAQTPKAKSPGAGSRAAMAQLATATAASDIQVAPGFKVELLYAVPKADQGSWVALTVDPKGRIIASDQYGGLYRINVPPNVTSTGTMI